MLVFLRSYNATHYFPGNESWVGYPMLSFCEPFALEDVRRIAGTQTKLLREQDHQKTLPLLFNGIG